MAKQSQPMATKKTVGGKHAKNVVGGGLAARVVACVVAVMVMLTGAFAAYSYADDTIPDFFSNPLGAIRAAVARLSGETPGLPQWVVDPSTATGWISDDSGVSTDTGSWNSKTTGRVWTDKTVWDGDATLKNVTGSSEPIVIENDDPNSALVSLSALSSAASITGTEVVTQPLDIVLVLDASSYMDAGTDVVTYEKIDDQVVNSGILHLLTQYHCVIKNSAGEYEDIVYVDGSWHLGDANGEIVDLSAQPIYNRITTETTKLDVLKDSANEFVESVAHMNENLDDTVKHHLSVVQFGAQESEDNTYTDSGTGELTSSTKVLQGLTVVDDTTKGTFTSAINGVQAEGNSSAIDLGMQQAQNVINQGGRGDAKKIVIVFTAGSPRHSWDQTISDMQIADPALEVAASLKDENGTDADIYTVGFFEAADSSVTTTWPNNLLQGISSNYPDAKVDGEAINLGGRDQTHDYYFNANSAEGLQSVFEALTQAIENNGKTPLEDEQVGGTTTPGYIEFTDTLGDFMEVKDFKSVVYAGTEFTNVGSEDNGDGTVTYTFAGTTPGNHVYTAGDLSDIQITVSKSDTAKTGDVVTVRIPASLIPLRYYQAEVNKDSVSTDFSEADAYPIRVFYTVGVKDEVLKSLDTPGDIDGLSGVISDDKATFMTNQYASGNNGTTTAEFTPAKDNGFYYFNDENGTVIYSSPDLNPDSRVTEGTLDKSKTYYYALEWFDKSGTWHTDAMQISPNSPVLNKLIEQEGGYLAVPMGTERYSRAQDFESPKTENKTQTATNAISPAWGEDGTVTVSLGNNGKVTHTVPGNLDISKTVDWGNGTEVEDTKFEFVVEIAGDTVVPGDFTFTIYDGEGTGSPVDGGTGTIQDGGSVFLEDGQHVVIEDIPGGLTYTVTEKVPAGFTANGQNSQDDEGNAVRIEDGMITSNDTATETFTNVYHANEVVLTGEDNLVVTKSLGRDWLEADSFDFTLKADNQTTIDAVKNGDIVIEGLNASLGGVLEGTESVSLTINNGSADHQSAFGDITFKKPGTYVFEIAETKGDIGGITYDESPRTVTVIVTDNNQGQLTIERTTVAPADPGLTFSNTYTAVDKTDEDITGTKKIEGRSFKEGDSFTFTVSGTGVAPDGTTPIENVPLPVGDSSSGAAGTFVISPTEDSEATIDFGAMTFTQLGTYTYTFKEAQGAEGNGITYDTADKTVTVTVTDENLDGEFEIKVAGEENLIWNNKYEAEPGEATISGNKQLEDRDWIADHDSFEFKLTPADEATKQAIINGDIEGFDTSGADPVLTVETTAEGDFNFAELTFNKVTGDAPYNFIIEEVVPDGASENKLNGITYDTHQAKVSVSVTDDGNGQLTATPTYSTVEGEASTFTNTYAPEPTSYDFSFGGAKTVTVESGSYTLEKGDFIFVLKPVGNAPMPTQDVDFVNPDDPDAGIKVTNGDASNNSASFSFAGSITFTEAGTYQYTVSEDTTATVPGIEFDDTEYTIEIKVTENKETGELTVGTPTVIAPDGTDATITTLDFDNTFDAGKASLSIPGTKNLSGRGFAPQGDTFSFNVSMVASDGGNVKMPEGLGELTGVSNAFQNGDGYSYTYTITPTGDGAGESASHAFDFGSITYDRAGTYTFTITENEGNAGGMSYDTGTTHTVVVEVSQNDQAALTADIVSIDGEAAADDSRVEFNNSYTASGTDSLEVTKQLGREWNNDDSFTFTLSAFNDAAKDAVKAGDIVLPGVQATAGDESMSITIAKADGVDGTYAKSFEDITFKKAGTYTFVVQEKAHDDAEDDVYHGVTYDTAARLVTITVSHDYQGGFTFSEPVVTFDGGAVASLTFNNVYDAKDATVSDLTVTKTLVGREWIEGDSFSFTLAADPDEVDQTTAAAITSGSIKLPGGGQAAQVTIPAAGEDVPKDENGTAAFGDITFTEEGTYHFILTEDAHGRPNVSHDDTTKHLTVEVRDNQEGSLVATPTWADGEQPTFTNTYTPDPDSLELQVQKTLPGAAWGNGVYTGRDWADNESFGFTVALTKGEASNVVMPDDVTATVGKPASDQTGTGAFNEIQLKAEGEYTFTITETSHTIGDTTLTGDQLKSPANGMTYDGHTTTVTVTVEDDPTKGDLVATPAYANTGASTSDAALTNIAAFTNTYQPATTVQALTVTKALQNRSWDGMSFGFTLTLDDQQSTVDVAGVSAATVVQLPDNATTLTIDSSDTASSTIANAKTDSFGDITFKAPGIYVFQVSEAVPQGAADNKYNGITYDATPRAVTVTVEDNGNGGLAVTDIEGADTNNLTFTNTYGATGVLSGEKLSVTKELTGRPWNDNDNFTFQITGVSAVDANDEDITPIPIPSGGSTISTATVGQFSFVGQSTTEKAGHFGDITFTQAGAYTYEVRETTSSGNGVTVATNSYQVHVDVTDDGQGNLTASDPVFENVTKPDQAGSAASSMHFTNKYDATDAAVTINIQKTLAGRNWENDDSFTFELERITTDAPMPGGAQADTVTETLEPNSGDTNPAIGSFDNITFTKADLGNDRSKTFEYEVKETGTDGNGLTLDKHTAKVTITVTDNGMGALSASVAYDNNTANVADGDRNNTTLAAFTNTYEAQPVTLKAETGLGLAGKKVMDGREFESGDTFTFQITEPQGSTAPDPSKTSVTITPTSGKEHTFSFGDDTTFTFDEAGTYVYFISEVNPNIAAGGSGLAGVDYDTLNYRLTVTIADNGDGQLVLKEKKLEHQSVTDPNAYAEASSLVFTNEYNAEQVTIQLRAHKTLSGRTLEAGEFGFQLVAHGSRTAGTDGAFVEDATQPMPTDAEARNTTNSQNNVTFGSMTFTQDMIGKEFQYGVIELQPTQDGTYNGAPLEGAEKNSDGNWVYKGVTYTHEERIITATVDSELVSGVETVRVTTKGESATFANTYDAADGTATIQVQKSVANRPWNQGETFGFTLKPVDGAPMPDGAAELTATATAEGAPASFPQITYTKADLDGAMSKTFEYTVTEVLPEGVSADSPAKDGLTYATDSQTVTVTVTDNGEGVITATPSGVLQFTNTYNAIDGTATIQVQKSVANRPWNQGETFGFTLKPVDGAPMPDGAAELTATATAEGAPASFPQITYTKADLDGAMEKTFTYTVTENLPKDDDELTEGVQHDGLTYDAEPQTVTVTVTDNGDGTITATPSAAPTFTNTYETADGTATISIQKTLTGRDWLGTDTFSFTVTRQTKNAPMPDGVAGDSVTVDVAPAAAGTAGTEHPISNATGAITFTKADLGGAMTKDFVYTVTENDTTLGGITKDAHAATVTIKVTDNANGTITAVPTYSNNAEGATEGDAANANAAAFTNSYKAKGSSAAISVAKTLDGRDWTEGDSFEFTLTPQSDNAKAAVDDGTITLPGNVTIDSADEDRTNAFGAITFGDVPDGDYTFVVSEVEPTENKIAGVEYDGTTYEITLNVADQNDGTLEVTVAEDSATKLDSALAFTNTYEATGELGADTISVIKSLTGRDWQDGDTFQFQIELDETGLAEDVIDTITVPAGPIEVTNGTDGHKAAFGAIGFNDTPDGEYTFVVSEVVPEDGDKLGGVTYDADPQTVKVKVTDDGKGGLTASLAGGQSGELTFENSYAASGELPDGTITVTKNFTGRPNDEWLSTDSFTFTLAGGDEKTAAAIAAGDIVLPEGASDAGITIVDGAADHKAAFGAIRFGDVADGDYTFTVTERKVENNGITYADPQTVTVTVTDNNDGTLKVEPKDGSNELTFTNTYKAAETTAMLNVEKVVTGANAPEDFEFALDFAESNQGPEDGVSGLTGSTAKIAGADLTLADGAEQDAETTSFGELTFSKEGVYTFAISETNPDHGNGWMYDNDDPNTVTVTVEDNDNGALVVRSVEYADDDAIAADTDTAATFTNRYTAGAVVVDDLSVTKQVEGNATDEDFTFELTLISDNAANVEGLGEGNKATATATDPFNATANKAATQKVTFSPLIFTEPGDYTFTVAETNTVPANTSWTYGADNSNGRRITVKVRDNGTGSLVVDGSDPAGESGIEGNNPTIVNRYEAEGTATITVEKVIANRDWLADNPETAEEYEGDSFDFALTAAGEATEKAVANGNVVMPAGDGATATVTSDTADHQAAFGAFTFNVPGTYTFDVTEQGQSHDGLTYDTDPKQVTVEVADNGDGTLTATVRDDAANNVADGVVTITNIYTAGGTVDLPEGGIDLTKVLKGRAWNESDAFTFTIAGKSATATDGKTAIDSIPMPEETQVTLGYADIAKNDDGTPATTEDGWNYADLAFGAIRFSQPGTYVYTVTEADTRNAGMTEPAPAEVTITVTDNLHGGYAATVTSVTGSPLVNVYGTQLDYSDAGGLTIVKTMSNQDITEGEFGFTVTPDDAASAALLGLDLDTWTEGQGKEFSTHAADLKIDANGNGVATAPITVLDNAAFTHEHDGSTYGFTIAETKAAEGNGYAKDTTVYHVAIAVADDAQGTITATTTVTVTTDDPAHPHDGATYTYTNTGEGATGPAQVTFTNDYDAQGALGEGAIKATKTLTNGQLMGSDFGFSVYDATGAKVASGTNAADGTITLGAIGYSTDQLMRDVLSNAADYVGKVDGKDTYTYAYTVREDTDAATGAPLDPNGNVVPGVTVNAGSFQITVTVTDNGNGELSAQVTYPQDTDHLAFRNTYGTVPGGAETLLVGGRKALDTGTTSGDNVPTLADIADKYTFKIQGSVVEGEDGPVPMPERTTATNDAAGNVTFGNIEFSIESVWGVQTDAADGETADGGVATQSVQRTKRFQYLVSEEGDVPGITNGVAQAFFVTVTDNGDGTVDVKCTSGNTGSTIELTPGEQFTITNEYRVAPVESSVTDAVSITKTLDGRALNEGEFTFDMALVSAPGETDPGFSVLTATNDADGAVSFPKLTFSQVGTYVYRISEEHGDLGGIAYDDSTYTATATVTDNGDGTLSVEWAVTDTDGQTVGRKGVIFANTYTADPATVGLAATKVLGGRELKDGEFTFELARTGEDAPMPGGARENTVRLTNAADGTIAIDPITFTQPGEYRYTLREVSGDAEGVTYDDAEHVITVTVTDNLAGALEADVSIDDGAATGIVFTNTYTAPAESDMPASGSAVAGTAVIAAMLLIAAAGIGVASKRSASRRGSNR